MIITDDRVGRAKAENSFRELVAFLVERTVKQKAADKKHPFVIMYRVC